METPPADILTAVHRAALHHEGLGDSAIRAMRRAGLHSIRPGTYIGPGAWSAAAAAEQHRLLVLATMPQLTPGAAVSHLSAAVLHGMPILGRLPSRVHITRDGQDGGLCRGQLHTHMTALESASVVSVQGCSATSAARTVIDVACTAGLHQGLCVADDALHRGLTTAGDLADHLVAVGRRRGMSVARRVVALADGGSESPGETLSRLRIRGSGLPEPALQYEIHGPDGLIGRTDFAWEEHRTLGEFDGAVKYRDLAPTVEGLRAVVLHEKGREQALRDLGWEVVRWGWRDLDDPSRLATRLRAAFARSRRRSA